MKLSGIAVMLLLVSALLVTGGICDGTGGGGGGGGGNIVKPKVGYVPTNWTLTADDSYGTYLDYGLYSGLVEYTDSWDDDFVQIFYGDIPSSLVSNPSDSSALIDRATFEAIFTPDDTGTMYVAGHLAGYAEAYDDYWDWWEVDIVFVHDSTYVDIYALYDNDDLDEEDVYDLISSIFF
jgi:hypothetical protein